MRSVIACAALFLGCGPAPDVPEVEEVDPVETDWSATDAPREDGAAYRLVELWVECSKAPAWYGDNSTRCTEGIDPFAIGDASSADFVPSHPRWPGNLGRRFLVAGYDMEGELVIRAAEYHGAYLCRGQCTPRDDVFALEHGDLFTRGSEIRLMQFGSRLSGRVLSDSPRRHVPPDSFSNWLYSRAVLEGPSGQAFYARAEALAEWARVTAWEDARAPRPSFAEPSAAVDLDRFFTGLVLLPDDHRREQMNFDPVLMRYPLWLVAMLIADTGRAEAMALRLARMAALTELDRFDRARAAMALGFLIAVDPTLTGELRFPCDSLPALFHDPFGVSGFGVALTKERPQNWAATLADTWVGCDEADLADAYATIAALGRAVE